MPDLAGVRVLIVEDESIVAMMLEEMLEELGCEIAASVASVARAEHAVRTIDVDLALLDVNLSGETTIDFARGLAGRPIPFAFCTGYGSAGVPADLRDRPVLTKPFAPWELRKAIERVLLPSD
ncbi:response regulator [Pelagerythrobacter rhizovicinus]|uniref:Response regulator n=1 Tax=Pelagerythrobacter rhizovicinus TaxID=2268576 RepID=A0A4Q2KPR6_9SPHN|nr:response regulator [Pelagerythrobacter rhizovicinus]RXZ65513.1 response regulator [Pelagerythrobacter rhizovicinus]